MRRFRRHVDTRRELPPQAVDSAIAVAILALGAFGELATPDSGIDKYFTLPHSQRLPAMVLLLLACLGTALRRTNLWLACGLVLLAALGGLFFWDDVWGNILPQVVLLYTVSERRSLGVSLFALVVSGVLVFPTQYHRNIQGGYAPFGGLPSLIEGAYPYLVLVWFAGRAQARRNAVDSELHTAVARLKEERERLSRVAVVAERSRIARDMYALVVRNVERMNAEARAARAMLQAEPTQARESIGAIEATGRATLVEMRRLTMVLRAREDTDARGEQFDKATSFAGPAAGDGRDWQELLPPTSRRRASFTLASSLRRWIDVPWVADTVLVLALALLAISEPLVGLPWPTATWPPFLPLVVLAVSALLFRRRFPLGVLAILTGEVFITNAFLGQGSPPYTVDRSMFVAVYTVSVTGGLLWGIVGLGAEVLAYAPLLFVRPQIWWPYDLAGWSAFFVFVVIGGLAVRSSRRLNLELQDQTELLRRTREERIRLAIVEERTRVARDLHDVVGHGVTAMVIQAGAARALAERDKDRAMNALGLVDRTGQDAIRELGSLLGDLGMRVDDRAASLPEPGDRSVGSLVGHAMDEGLRVELRIEGHRVGPDPGLDVVLFRIVQEALTNVRKHAPGSKATVAIRYLPHAVEVEVTNDKPATSRGPEDMPGAGQGLMGIRERAAVFGGTVDVGPTAEGGFRVFVELPLELVQA